MKKYPTNHAYYILVDSSKENDKYVVGRISKYNNQFVGKRYSTLQEAQEAADKMSERRWTDSFGEKQLQDAFKNEGVVKWISVKDDLPKDSRRILFTTIDGIYIGTVRNKSNGLWIAEGMSWGVGKVTHWSALPDPPKQ